MPDRDIANVPWIIGCIDINQDRHCPRSGIPSQAAHQLIGFDGAISGGLRPCPGFRYYDAMGTGTGNVTFFRAVVLRVNTDSFKAGFIIRRSGKVYFKSIDNPSNEVLLKNAGDDTSPMDVQVWGRQAYIFIQGQSPILFWYDADGVTIKVILTPGPGAQPTLWSADQVTSLGTLTAISGQVVFTDQLPSQWTGLGLDPVNGQLDTNVRPLVPGNYAFAYRLYDSRTGRWGPLSTFARAAEYPDFFQWQFYSPSGSSGSGSGELGHLAPGVNEITSTTEKSLYAAMEIVYDSTLWDTAYVYRSVRSQSAGGVYSTAALLLDRTFLLSAYAASAANIANQGSGSGSGSASGSGSTSFLHRSIYWYEPSDEQLVNTGQTYVDSGTFDLTMPFGGAACFYEGSMIVGAIRAGVVDFSKNLGEFRWSSLVINSPECFSPLSRYVPDTPTAGAIRILRVGPNAIGFARDRMYHIRRESVYIKFQEMHLGYGIVNPNAVCVVGSLAYFLTSRGLKVVDTNGQLEDVRAVDFTILEEWRGNLNRVSLTYDSTAGIIFMHNPDVDTGRTIALWVNTGQVREIWDTAPFVFAESGVFPTTWTYGSTPSGNLVSRAFFCTLDGRIYLYDWDRQKPSQCLMDPINTTFRYTVSGAGTAAITIPSSPIGEDNRSKDCYLYVMTDPTVANVGAKAQIDSVSHGIATVKAGLTFSATARLAVSPVYCRAVFGPVLTQSEQGVQFADPSEFFRIKQLQYIQAAFVDVGGAAAADTNNATDSTFRGLVFSSNAQVPITRAWVRDHSGNLLPSVVEEAPATNGIFGSTWGELASTATVLRGASGGILCPGLETFVPELDYRLVSVKVQGSVRGTDRLSRGL